MAPSESSLRNEELEGDGSGSGKQGRTGRNCTKMLGRGVGTGATVLEQKLKIITRTANPAQLGNPREAFDEFEITKMETLDRTDNKLLHSVDRGRTPVEF